MKPHSRCAWCDVPYRMLIPMEVRSNLERLFPAGRACLGLFATADELGVGFVSGVAPPVLVDRQSVLPGSAEAADGARNLVVAERGDAVDLVVRIPKAVRSVFRGRVRPRLVASADIIQVWLDVSEHPSRIPSPSLTLSTTSQTTRSNCSESRTSSPRRRQRPTDDGDEIRAGSGKEISRHGTHCTPPRT